MSPTTQRSASRGQERTPRKDTREKVTAALDANERAALDYILDITTRVQAQRRPNSADMPVITADMSDEQRSDLVGQVYEHELNKELQREFGTLDLPVDKANLVRFSIRLLARTLRGASTRAGMRAAEADPVQATENTEWTELGAKSIEQSSPSGDPDEAIEMPFAAEHGAKASDSAARTAALESSGHFKAPFTGTFDMLYPRALDPLVPVEVVNHLAHDAHSDPELLNELAELLADKISKKLKCEQ